MIDVAKLRKVHAMTASPNANEAAVAWSKVDAMLSAEGKTRAHLPGLLAPQIGGAGGYPPFMHGFRVDPNVSAQVEEVIRALREAQRRRQDPENHPDGRIGFLYVNRHHLKEGELREMLAIAAGGRRLNRKQAATADYLVQRVRARRAGKEAGHG